MSAVPADDAVYDALKYRVRTDSNGGRWYYNSSGQLHRDEGPAIMYAGGGQEWWQNGQLHREDGPAVVWADGTKMWYQNGKLHRENGPAIEHSTNDKHLPGVRCWFLLDAEYQYRDYCKAVKQLAS